MTLLPKRSLKILTLLTVLTAMGASTGCQTLRAKPTSPVTGSDSISNPQAADNVIPAKLDNFMINGKIGITTPATDTQAAQAGSAFYVWGQQNNRFAIELMGALGIGKTNIEFDGQTATLVSEKAGTLTATSPDELLQKATGWQVPISQLPYWISGRSAPSDSEQQNDGEGRLIAAINGEWTGTFSYANGQSLPNKITARHQRGHKVVMTINHQSAPSATE